MAKETVEALCKKAQQAVSQGKNEEARQFYLQALGLRSDLPDVHYGLATVCFLLNDLPSAAYHFKEVTRLDPLRAGAFINLGAVYNRLDLLDEAIPALRRGIQLDLTRAEGYYNLGLVYRRKGQLDLAIQAYREATRVNPRMTDAHYNLGNLFLEKGQPALAIAHYKQALELRPNWEKAQRGLEQAEAILAEQERESQPVPLGTAPAPVRPAPLTPAPHDPSRMLDPVIHGNLLTILHKATIESDTHGRLFLRILEDEIEPAIKELSSCLLYPNISSNELDHCVQKFETAIANMRNAQRHMQSIMDRVRTVGEQLAKS
jgi:tetratricopeptide (TPR) repeat protein